MFGKYLKTTLLGCVALGMLGCATHISKPSGSNEPTKVRLATYEQVYMKDVSISREFAEHNANQKAKNRIDEHIFNNLRMVFPSLQRLPDQGLDTKSASKALIIEPYIKEIKFIGGGARFMAGAIAGSSAVLMQTTFIDASANDVIAAPEFYRAGNAYSGAWTMGATDNKMLEDIANDVVTYASNNK